jgi:hypothetical protein
MMTTGSVIYQIIAIGGAPGVLSFPDEGATCAEWSLLKDKTEKEVIAVDLVTKEVIYRYSAAETERIADDWRNPTIR